MRCYIIFAGLMLYLNVHSVQSQVFDNDSAVRTITDTLTDVTDNVLSDINRFRIGIGPVVSSDYDGSDNYKPSVKPLLTLRYRDIFQIDNNRLRVFIVGSDALFPSETFKLGPLVKISPGRHEEDNPDLAGLGRTGTSIEFGVFASYELGPAQIRLRYQQDVANGHSGTLVVGDVQSGVYQTDNLTVIASVSLRWADGNYMETSFGIDSQQALASGLPVFDAGSGLKDVRAGFGANYNLSDHWSVLGFAGYARMLGDAGNSPIVSLRGSPNQVATGIFAAYRF